MIYDVSVLLFDGERNSQRVELADFDARLDKGGLIKTSGMAKET